MKSQALRKHVLIGVLTFGAVACDEGVTIGVIDLDAAARGDRDDATDESSPSSQDDAGATDLRSLTVSLQVTATDASEDLPCSRDCANVTAVVNDPTEGLIYRWSDGSLSGPGPHRICTDQPPLTVSVDVESPGTSGEFAMEARHGSASAQVERSAYCECEEDASDRGEFMDDPREGVNYAVCSGSPRLEQVNGLRKYQVVMLSGEKLSYPLKRPIEIGERFQVSWGLEWFLTLELEAATSLCGDPMKLELPDNIGGGLDPQAWLVNDTGQRITHMLVGATGTPPPPAIPGFPVNDTLEIRYLGINHGCER